MKFIQNARYNRPMNRLDALRDDLWNRWQNAFDRFAELESASQSGERVIYANGDLFDLEKYTPHEFPVGGRVFLEQPEITTSYHRYRLDVKGRPVHMASGHTVNHLNWEGFYRYTSEEAEYLEFCLQTRVVSKYSRMTLQDGVPQTFQCIRINGGASHIGGLTGKSAISRIMNESYFPLIEIEMYETSADRILSAKALAIAPGQSPHRFDLEYSYSNAGKLKRIVVIRDDGSRHTSFAARSEMSMKGLSAKLSERIADRVVDVLRNTQYGAKLQAVELPFRSVTDYVPSVIPALEGDSVSDMAIVLATPPERWIELNQEDFEPLMAEFLERMNTDENWNPGAEMLRYAASLVTKQVPELMPAADGFVCFAIDGEFEGHDLLPILNQCGATDATLDKLRKIEWLESH